MKLIIGLLLSLAAFSFISCAPEPTRYYGGSDGRIGTDRASRRVVYEQWYRGLSPADQVRYKEWDGGVDAARLAQEDLDRQVREERERDREDRREAARLLGLGLALSGGGPFRVPMAPVYQAPAFTPAPYQYLAPRQPTNCTSNIVGSSVYTNCY